MKKYLITTPTTYSDLSVQIQNHNPDFVLFRDKLNPSYEQEAKNFLDICKRYEGIKAFLHQDVALAHRLQAVGVHLTSSQFEFIQEAKQKGLEVIVSTHSHEEVLLAQELGADYVTYSPIFQTPQKGEPKGVQDLCNIAMQANIKIFALGGIIDQQQVDQINKCNVYGFASIRYFN